jgi:biopolymer transport protein ExbD
MANNTKELPEVTMDMTPMIDMVFNLLIFFMLVNQMVQEERAELELPVADEAKEEQILDKKRLIINVKKEGSVEIAGRSRTWAELTRILFEESRISRDREGISTRSVLIRGDIETPYRAIQKVMVECARQKIHKISFAAKIPEK